MCVQTSKWLTTDNLGYFFSQRQLLCYYHTCGSYLFTFIIITLPKRHPERRPVGKRSVGKGLTLVILGLMIPAKRRGLQSASGRLGKRTSVGSLAKLPIRRENENFIENFYFYFILFCFVLLNFYHINSVLWEVIYCDCDRSSESVKR